MLCFKQSTIIGWIPATGVVSTSSAAGMRPKMFKKRIQRDETQ